MNDTQRLDFLQSITQGYGNGWILRESMYERGYRLHETSHDNAVLDVREAIDNFHAKYMLRCQKIDKPT